MTVLPRLIRARRMFGFYRRLGLSLRGSLSRAWRIAA